MSRPSRSRRHFRFSTLLTLAFMLAACTLAAPAPDAAQSPAPIAQASQVPSAATSVAAAVPTYDLATATLAGTPAPRAGHYQNFDLGVELDYPHSWSLRPGEQATTLTWLVAPQSALVSVLFYGPMTPGLSLEQAAKKVRDDTSSGTTDVELLDDHAGTIGGGRAAWISEYRAQSNGTPVHVIVTSAARGARLFTLMSFGAPAAVEKQRAAINTLVASMQLSAPLQYGIPRDQALFLLGGESNNPRAYDPATSGGNDLVFSGLVTLNPQLQVIPDLAESWAISPDGTVYTFRLRANARFHNRRRLLAQDVIYSWERAAAPATESNTVLTYLGDIVGVQAMHAGTATHIAGLKALDDHTLQVTIDAPKPYFLMKLTYGTASVVDRDNVESGPEWYRRPNGSGPYRLIRWEPLKLQLYERNDDFYLAPPAIRFVVVQLFAGVGIRMYETGEIDVTGVGLYDADRVREPSEPLHRDLREGVSMCTSYISFDVTQPPFDDPKVRQAFALAVDRQRYIDVVLRGKAVPARGLYPPALPGYSAGLHGLDFDPALARQRLSESKYATLPPIVFTSSGFGSDVGGDVSALIDMWQKNLGVTIQVENLEPSKYTDEIHQGHHGQLFSQGWCADYPDPENFADALFYSKAQQNIGHYANAALDTLLERARVERDVEARMRMYHQAEQTIVDDAAAIFLDHGLSFLLVKPAIKGYELTPIHVPIERYLSIDAAQLDS